VENLPPKIQKAVLEGLVGSLAGLPVRTASGTHRNRELVLSTRGKTISVRRHKLPRDPNTAQQKLQRSEMRAAVKLWSQLTMQQRKDWKNYAELYRDALRISEEDLNFDCNLFRGIQQFCRRIGGEFIPDSPLHPPPRRASAILQAVSDSPTTFCFRIQHSIADTTGMHVLFEITPATKNPLTCKPLEKHFVYICGLNEASFQPLQESGAVYRIRHARFAVKPGERFGVRIRILSAEHVPSGYTANDLTREDFQMTAPEIAVPGTESEFPTTPFIAATGEPFAPESARR
jgi:hypothetical protein